MNNRRNFVSIILLNIILVVFCQNVNASQLKYGNYIYKVNSDNTITLLRYVGPETKELKIPDLINGLEVKKIGHKIFKENRGVRYISLPRTGYIFEKGCFLPFYFRNSDGVGLYFKILFNNKIARGFLDVNGRGVYDNESIRNIAIKYKEYRNQDIYVTKQGFIRTKDKILYCFDTDARIIKIPDGIKSIVDGAFDVEMLSLSDEAEEFYEDGDDLRSYYNNNLKYKMKKIIMSNELEYIGGRGNFEECPNLRYFKCMDNVEYSYFHRNYCFIPYKKSNELFINNKGTLVFAMRGSKYNEKNNNEYIIPDNVMNIRENAFDNYIFDEKTLRFNNNLKVIPKLGETMRNNISEVVLPESLQEIEAYAFMHFTNLKEITIPSSVKHIGIKSVGYIWDEDSMYDYAGIKVEGFKIYGEVGSDAEKYAKGNGFEFYDVKTNKLQIYDEENVRNRDDVWVIVWISIVVIISLIVGVVLYINNKKR